MTMNDELDLEGALPLGGRLVVEASAGTGKTYSLTAMVVRYVAENGLKASELLVVTFTRAAAAELRDRTRRALSEARTALDTGVVPERHRWMRALVNCSDEERKARFANVEAAVKSFDDATITTIHGFCQQALRQLGLRSGARLGSELVENTDDVIDEVCRDLVIQRLSPSAGALSWPGIGSGAPSTVLKRLREAVTALLGNAGAVAAPALQGGATPSGKDTVERLGAWLEVVDEAVKRVRARRSDRHELGYDDLVTQLRDAIVDPDRGEEARRMLQTRYRLVLVDEFQDTDPVQWEVFGTGFGNEAVVITVGDPKQAIYRFRGADVDAYLRATEGVDKRDLRINFRSDQDLVTGTLGLLGGVQLGHPRIEVSHVSTPDSAPVRALPAHAPLQIRWVPRHDGLLGGKDATKTKKGDPGKVFGTELPAPLARRAILGDLVRTVVDLLEQESVSPGDIAVLVPSHAGAEQVVGALNRAGVPVVRTRTGSVFATGAAQQWRLLLAALERPSYAPYVRAAGMSSFLHVDPKELDPDAPGSAARVAELQQQCAVWADLLADHPVLTWYHEVRSKSGVVEHLLSELTGERELTDLDHIAELLAAELPGAGHSPAAVRRALEQFMADAESRDELGPQMRRIDSDAAAVQVTTLHASKGLQYPIVLIPFSYSMPNNQGPLIYNGPDGRLIDVASGQGWNGTSKKDSERGRTHWSNVERRADQLRLLYVGLTRGEHRTIVWWAPVNGGAKSALTTVLFDRDASGVPINDQPDLIEGPRGGISSYIPSFEPTDDEVVAHLTAIANRAPGCIEIAAVPERTALTPWSGPGEALSSEPLAIADAQGRSAANEAWRRWSFTGIQRTRNEPWSPFVPLPAAPVSGGHDEPENVDDDLERVGTNGTSGAAASSAPLADVAAGTAFGTLVHEVFEAFDPLAEDLEAALLAAVRVALRRNRVPVDPALLARGLALAASTPLGPLANGLRLADIGRADRLAELEFDLPLVDGPYRIAASGIGEVLLNTLPAGDPLRGYAQELAAGRFTVDLAGYLQGSIDAVLRVPTDSGHRFIVVDYKTNRLHQRGAADPLAAYHPTLLVDAMTHSDYPLQALLYSVAVHRYLRWRLPGYRPEEHLGGIAYLFVRGMVGAGTPQHEGVPYGVFSWKPPAATVLALDELFISGRAA